MEEMELNQNIEFLKRTIDSLIELELAGTMHRIIDEAETTGSDFYQKLYSRRNPIGLMSEQSTIKVKNLERIKNILHNNFGLEDP